MICTAKDFVLHREDVRVKGCMANAGMTLSHAPVGWRLWIAEGNSSRYASALIEQESNKLMLRVGSMLYGPIYFGPSIQQIGIIASDPSLVAAVCQGDVDWCSFAEDLLFGYRLGRKTLYENTSCLLPNELIQVDSSRDARVITFNTNVGTDTNKYVTENTALIDSAKNMLQGDEAFELTGGVDSRLVLALALAAGIRPRLAFTLGEDDSFDVIVARHICEQFSLEHVVIQPSINKDRLPQDARKFVAESGYTANSTSYGWLPSVYRQLDDIRDAQATGAGGECAGGFYDSHLDNIVSKMGIEKWWIRHRLAASVCVGTSLFNHDVSDHVEIEIRREIADVLSLGEPFRRCLDRIYTEQRVRQWAAPVLRASSAWYQVKAPLLGNAYLSWTRTLPLHHRGRAAQRDLIARLSLELANLPYAYDLGRKSHLLRCRSKILKYKRKIFARTAPADLGSIETALCLSRDTDVQDTIESLVGDHPGIFQRRVLASLRSDPARFANEYGFLVSAAWAYQAAQRWRKCYETPKSR